MALKNGAEPLVDRGRLCFAFRKTLDLNTQKLPKVIVRQYSKIAKRSMIIYIINSNTEFVSWTNLWRKLHIHLSECYIERQKALLVKTK